MGNDPAYIRVSRLSHPSLQLLGPFPFLGLKVECLFGSPTRFDSPSYSDLH